MRQKVYGITFFSAVVGCLLVGAVATPGLGQQAYPTKYIDVLITMAPGASVDLTERMLAHKAEKFLGQKLVITNNGAGASAVGIAIGANKPPDGYHIIGCSSTGLVRVPHFRDVPYKLDDVVPIMHFAAPVLTSFVVRSDSPWKSVKDLVEYARKNPGKIKYSTLGIGSPMHMAMEYIGKQEGVTFTHVPYQGTMPAFTALLGGHVQVQLGSGECVPYIKDGTVRLLANVGERRVKNFPDVPTLIELGYDYFNESVFMFAAPKGTPKAIIDALDNAFHQAMADPEFTGLVAKLELETTYRNAADTKKYLEAANARIGRLVKELKMPKETEDKK